MIDAQQIERAKGLLTNLSGTNTNQIMKYLAQHYPGLYPNNEADQNALQEQLDYIRETPTNLINVANLVPWENVIVFFSILDVNVVQTDMNMPFDTLFPI